MLWWLEALHGLPTRIREKPEQQVVFIFTRPRLGTLCSSVLGSRRPRVRYVVYLLVHALTTASIGRRMLPIWPERNKHEPMWYGWYGMETDSIGHWNYNYNGRLSATRKSYGRLTVRKAGRPISFCWYLSSFAECSTRKPSYANEQHLMLRKQSLGVPAGYLFLFSKSPQNEVFCSCESCWSDSSV